jgi:hypothetical protein
MKLVSESARVQRTPGIVLTRFPDWRASKSHFLD